jgi:hypothetical protein
MASEKVEKLGVKKEKGFLYFVRGNEVFKNPMKRAGGPSAKGKEERVATGTFTPEEGYLYFVDKHGDVGRSKRAVGGQKRKKTKAAKKVTKKGGKKGGAKKAKKKGKR